MRAALRRAVRLTIDPGVEWQAVRSEDPEQRKVLAGFVLPMACIPATAWVLGSVLAEGGSAVEMARVAHRGGVAFFGAVVSICLLAVSMYVLAPLFVARRNWLRAFQVAAYSSAPVMLGGVLLVVPDFSYALLLPVLQSFYLQYLGVHCILEAKEGDAAEYVALGVVLLVVTSTLAGAFGAWAGVL